MQYFLKMLQKGLLAGLDWLLAMPQVALFMLRVEILT